MENLIAHRGLKKNGALENSLLAFSLAILDPLYGGFECDVRTSLDGVFVICHGPFYKGKVISLSKYSDLLLPRLDEVLSLDSKKIFLLELKEMNVDCDKLNKVLEKYCSKRIYCMSFYNQVIKRLGNLKHSYKLGVLNYVLNSESSYDGYDFICLLEAVYSEKLKVFFQNLDKEVFIYGIHKKSSYDIEDVFLITDKVS